MTSKTKKEKVAKVIPDFDFRTIKTFEDACAKLGIDPKNLPDLSLLSEDCLESIIAYYKLIVIYKAINDGWTPDWGNARQWKYYPYFWVLSSGFGFSGSHCGGADTDSICSSRLCTNTSEKAMYIAKQFEKEYIGYLLLKK